MSGKPKTPPLEEAAIDEPIADEAQQQPAPEKKARKSKKAPPHLVGRRIVGMASKGLQLASHRVAPETPLEEDEAASIVEPTGRIITRHVSSIIKFKASEDVEDVLEILATIAMYILRIILWKLIQTEAKAKEAAQRATARTVDAAAAAPTMPPVPPAPAPAGRPAAAAASNGNSNSVFGLAALIGAAPYAGNEDL